MVNKHTSEHLAQMQSMPLDAKILMTQLRIRAWYDHWDGDVYVSFSGGKDSTVLKHIVDSMYNDVPALFVNTGLEYPEIQKFVRDIKSGKYDCFNSDIEIIRPEMRFDEVLKVYGYPIVTKAVSNKVGLVKKLGNECKAYQYLSGTCVSKDGKSSMFNCSKWQYLIEAPFGVSSKCCDVMKKKPAKQYTKKTGRKPIIGTLATESKMREKWWIKHGCNAFDKQDPSSQPLSFWTEQDILHYIKKFNIPYASVYGDIVVNEEDTEGSIDGQVTIYEVLEDYKQVNLKTTGCVRTGCIFCGYGCHLEKEPNRFQMLKRTHPKQYEYCINGGEMIDGKWQPNKNGLGLGKVLDYIGVDYK